ncbi:hypothetical protein [Agromyces sp. NBRC 114283]|uniref:hypothetical protein n=1 Tax=Agromyces sp. NBRC 114283 TaxID=2994521 RepID=UPI0024A577A8|nr:hypothetical protein [Agromyces sp. NBRC 114283]GLU90299.1 hypothetical protein Agsp01_25540 [Agromyces sp. NBRC 114283]
MFEPTTVYRTSWPGCTAVPDAGSADFVTSKPGCGTGWLVVTSSGTSAVPPGGVADAFARFVSVSPSAPSSTVTA